MRLPRRIQILLGGFLAVVTLALGLDVAVLRIRDRTFDDVRLVYDPARIELARLLAALLDQETSQRGYLLTGDETFLDTYDAAAAVSAESRRVLARTLRHDETLLAAVHRTESRVNAWQDLGAEFEIAARRDGLDNVVSSLVGTGTSRRLFDEARAEIDGLAALLDEIIADERHDLARLDDLLLVFDGAMLLAAIAALVSVGYLSQRWITRPLHDLSRSVQAVAGGALRSTVAVASPPEFTELATDVDSMRRRILAEVEEAERAREALAERGMVVLTLRDELAAAAPDLPAGVRLAGRFAPAQGVVAGDWYDVLRLSDDRLAIALVDVSGHGAGVGAFALRTKALTLAAVATHEPGDAFGWVAERLGDTGEQFLTGVILVVDVPRGTVRYASAGHPPLLLAGLTGITELGPTGPMLGPMAATWRTEEVTLTRGGAVVAFSDGLIEARDERGRVFGIERLVAIVEDQQLNGPDAVADACIGAVQQHQASREDDLTLVVLSR